MKFTKEQIAKERKYWRGVLYKMCITVPEFSEYVTNPSCDNFYDMKDALVHNYECSYFSDGLDCGNIVDGVYITSGCTRAVFVSEHSNIVLKVNLVESDDWRYNYRIDRKTKRRKSKRNAGLKLKSRKMYDEWQQEDNIDYCANEANVYKQSRYYGCQECFAWSQLLFRYGKNHVPFYGMEVVSVFDEDDEDEDGPYETLFRAWCDNNGYDIEDDDAMIEARQSYYFEGDTDDMMDYAYLHWNGCSYNHFEDFCDRADVADLHSQNWGFTRDGDLVVCDYASYNQIAGVSKRELERKIKERGE